ncbi:hypothetical protein LCGC14_0947850, partial [marine sediment metagenome]
MKFDDETGTLTINEFELHDMVADMNVNINPGRKDAEATGSLLERIKIIPKEPNDFTPGLVNKYEVLLNNLILMTMMIDSDIH